jgi:ubiquinone/menaquinone biosynthesis C-methylase UbiE
MLSTSDVREPVADRLVPGHSPQAPQRVLLDSSTLRLLDSVLRRRSEAAELLDQEGHDPGDLAANLRDIRAVNRLAGGAATVLRHLPALAGRVPRGRPVELLDLATGSGDIPLAVHQWAARNGRSIRLTVSDLSPPILAAARRTLAGIPDVTFMACDARAVPLADGAFDIALCSLALHHFAPGDAVRVLREMNRLSRVGFIVNDIRRCVPGYLAAWAASRVATRNRLTRHDMPLSVRRAYTPRELRGLLLEAGIGDAKVTTHPLFRMAGVRSKSEDPNAGVFRHPARSS